MVTVFVTKHSCRWTSFNWFRRWRLSSQWLKPAGQPVVRQKQTGTFPSQYRANVQTLQGLFSRLTSLFLTNFSVKFTSVLTLWEKKNNCTTLILTGSECGSVHNSGACLHGCGQGNDIPISMNLCANSYDEKIFAWRSMVCITCVILFAEICDVEIFIIFIYF